MRFLPFLGIAKLAVISPALLAGKAVTGPGHGVQALGRDGFFASGADAVGSLTDAAQGILQFAEELQVQGVAIHEEPLFVTLLAQVALVVRVFGAGQHLGGFFARTC